MIHPWALVRPSVRPSIRSSIHPSRLPTCPRPLVAGRMCKMKTLVLMVCQWGILQQPFTHKLLYHARASTAQVSSVRPCIHPFIHPSVHPSMQHPSIQHNTVRRLKLRTRYARRRQQSSNRKRSLMVS